MLANPNRGPRKTQAARFLVNRRSRPEPVATDDPLGVSRDDIPREPADETEQTTEAMIADRILEAVGPHIAEPDRLASVLSGFMSKSQARRWFLPGLERTFGGGCDGRAYWARRLR